MSTWDSSSACYKSLTTLMPLSHYLHAFKKVKTNLVLVFSIPPSQASQVHISWHSSLSLNTRFLVCHCYETDPNQFRSSSHIHSFPVQSASAFAPIAAGACCSTGPGFGAPLSEAVAAPAAPGACGVKQSRYSGMEDQLLLNCSRESKAGNKKSPT